MFRLHFMKGKVVFHQPGFLSEGCFPNINKATALAGNFRPYFNHTSKKTEPGAAPRSLVYNHKPLSTTRGVTKILFRLYDLLTWTVGAHGSARKNGWFFIGFRQVTDVNDVIFRYKRPNQKVTSRHPINGKTE